MGKQSKSKTMQASAQDKDIECIRTPIEKRLIEEAKFDDDKTEQLHAFVDNILCPYKPDYSATHHNRHKCNGEIFNRYIRLPITSIDDVPIMASIIVTVRIEEVQHINGDISKQDVININGDISSPSLFDEEEDNLDFLV